MALQRPKQALIKVHVTGAAIAIPTAPVVKQDPAITADMQVEAIISLVHRKDWDRTLAKEIIGHIVKRGYTLDTAFKRGDDDRFAYLVKDAEGVRTVVKVGPSKDDGKLLAYLDTVSKKEFRVKVRQYMTKPASDEWDFPTRYNGGVPMPLRIMTGTVLEETKGMVKMALHGQAEPSSHCFKCGRTLTHPVSRYYGIGPECGEHYHINPLGSEEALNAVMDEIKAKMAAITWTGWVIRSAIESMEEAIHE